MFNPLPTTTDQMPHSSALFSANDCEECFVALESTPTLNLEKSWEEIMQKYSCHMKHLGLSSRTEVMVRVHLSDIANQRVFIRSQLAERKTAAFISLVGQPPASGGKIALEAYHIRSTRMSKDERMFGLVVNHEPYSTIWANCQPARGCDSFSQTQEMFQALCETLTLNDSTLSDNLARTWIYVRDVDNNYQGMVDARRELFECNGLTSSTHYVASTGIEGLSENVSHLVCMDGLIVSGITSEQLVHLQAPQHLCPTHLYDVTFERASRLIFGDRSHYYISGTASIDREGKVLHEGNVIRQAERILENISALLETGDAVLNDLKQLVVYLRDSSDYSPIKTYLDKALPNSVPYIIVQGAVCRPSWLIEMEGIAVNDRGCNNFAPFCG